MLLKGISLTNAIKKLNYGKFVTEIIPLQEIFILNKNNIKIKYPAINSKVSSLVGTAYDYLVRIYLFKKYRNKLIVCGSDGIPTNSTKKFLGGFICQKAILLIINKLNSSEVSDKYYDSMDIILQYIENDNLHIDNILLESIIFISNFDAVFRSRYDKHLISGSWKDSTEDALKDLENLVHTLASLDKKLNPSKKIYLNLTTGYVNKYISSSDCDLIIDDILIDIKTTKDIKFTLNEFAQLIGYYMAIKKHNILINKIGIYYSRYNKLHVIDINDIGLSEDKIKKLYNWTPKK